MNIDVRILDAELRFGVEAECGGQLRAVDGEKREIRSGGEGKVERETEGSGAAESALDPVEGGGVGVGEREEIKEEGSGGGLLEVGTERGGEVAEFGLVFVFEARVGREEGEVGTAGEGAGRSETGSESMASRRTVDGEEERSGSRGPGGGVNESGRSAGRFGIVAEEDGEGKRGNVERGIHGMRIAGCQPRVGIRVFWRGRPCRGLEEGFRGAGRLGEGGHGL